MNASIIMALGALLMITVTDIINSKVLHRGSMHQILSFYVIVSLSSFGVIFAYFEISAVSRTGIPGLPNTLELIYGLCLGVVAVASYMLYLSSLSKGSSASPSVTIYRLNLIPSILLSIIFLSEKPTILKWLAILLCISAIFLLRERSESHMQNRQLFLALGACLGAGVLNLLNKATVIPGATTSSGLLFVRCTVVAIFSVLMLIAGRRKILLPKKVIALGAASGILLAAEILLVMEALKTGMVSMIIPITQLSFVFVAAYYMLTGKEKPVLKRQAAMAMALVSIVVISL